METKKGKSFQWKLEHPHTSKPIRIIFKVQTSEKEDPKILSPESIPTTFSQLKEGNQQINESKAPEWMDVKVKTKEVDISNDDRTKMEKIGDYWNEE